MICIPLLADQWTNAQNYVRLKVATVDFRYMTQKEFDQAIDIILKTPEYGYESRKSVRHKASSMRKQNIILSRSYWTWSKSIVSKEDEKKQFISNNCNREQLSLFFQCINSSELYRKKEKRRKKTSTSAGNKSGSGYSSQKLNQTICYMQRVYNAALVDTRRAALMSSYICRRVPTTPIFTIDPARCIAYKSEEARVASAVHDDTRITAVQSRTCAHVRTRRISSLIKEQGPTKLRSVESKCYKNHDEIEFNFLQKINCMENADITGKSRLLRGHTLLASPPELDIFFRTRCLVPSCECGSRFCRRWQVPNLLCRLHLVSVVLASGATL
ncbi:unnamed protein product [Trichogramma brassicae]|uniref:Uncharacterized protein n=1 Tax=Trichogramma brassicae TaxID=86971 RepID=A0A6H5IW80_9HYME|nr:unnamed protein product [Trichogramma brassicae]